MFCALSVWCIWMTRIISFDSDRARAMMTVSLIRLQTYAEFYQLKFPFINLQWAEYHLLFQSTIFGHILTNLCLHLMPSKTVSSLRCKQNSFIFLFYSSFSIPSGWGHCQSVDNWCFLKVTYHSFCKPSLCIWAWAYHRWGNVSWSFIWNSGGISMLIDLAWFSTVVIGNSRWCSPQSKVCESQISSSYLKFSF